MGPPRERAKGSEALRSRLRERERELGDLECERRDLRLGEPDLLLGREGERLRERRGRR